MNPVATPLVHPVPTIPVVHTILTSLQIHVGFPGEQRRTGDGYRGVHLPSVPTFPHVSPRLPMFRDAPWQMKSDEAPKTLKEVGSPKHKPAIVEKYEVEVSCPWLDASQ
jgi:hypothetical protein